MNWQLFALAIGLRVIVGCGSPSETNRKEEGIQVMKAEMKALCDSSNMYFELGLTALENGVDPDSVSRMIQPVTKRLEARIDERSRAFHEEAVELGLTKEEYDRVFKDLGGIITPIQVKYKELKRRGVSL